MATLENYLSLRDGFSPVLDKIAKASETVSNKLNKVSNVAERVGGSSRKMTPAMYSVEQSTIRAGNAMQKASGQGGILSSVFLGGLGANIAMMAIDKVTDSIGALISTADEYASIKARLGLVAGSQQNAIHLNQEIFESAQRARGGYLNMANAVTQLAQSAKDAFPDPREAVDFMEGVNKLFAIGGADTESRKSATLQLTQGMASGALMGDEFRSISENAPIIQDMIAKTMGVSRGELKSLASEGKITADVIKSAVLENMDEINAQFATVPKTWGDNLTWIQNQATMKFGAVFNTLSNMANNATMDKLLSGIDTAIDYIAGGVYFLVNHAMWLAGVYTDVVGGAVDFLSSNTWILYGAMVALGGYLAFTAIMWGVNAVQVGAAAVAMATKTIADWAETAAILALIIAQDGLNAALYACPITWIVAGVVILIGVFYAAVAAVNYFAGTSISATGIIFGAFAWLYARVRNVVAMMWNMFAAIANFWGTVFVDPMTAVENLFADVWNAVAGYVVQAVNEILGALAKIPGITKLGIDLSPVTANTIERKEVAGGQLFEVPTMDYVNPIEYANSGYEMGESVQNKVVSTVEGIINGPGDIMAKMKAETPEWDTSKLPATESRDPNEKDNAKNHGKTAKNTEKIANAIEMTDEDIKSLRDSAMANTLQQWQNQHIVINVDNTITANNDVDLDGFTSDFANNLRDTIRIQGEGVLA